MLFTKFYNFLFQNYYHPLSFDEFGTQLDDWLENNPQIHEEYSASLAQRFVDDLNPKTDFEVDLLENLYPSIYDADLGNLYHEYFKKHFTYACSSTT